MLENRGNGVLSTLFGTRPQPVTTPTKVDHSPIVTTTDYSPENICTGDNFTLTGGILMGAVQVTPQIAEAWLERNEYNTRRMFESTWKKYADEMRKGQWIHNGSSIDFDKDGYLINGQHRLRGCIEAGVPFITTVHYGVRDSKNTDTGLARTLAQVLESLGFTEGATVSAGINKLHAYADEGSVGFKTVGHGRHHLSRVDACEFAVQNEAGLKQSLAAIRKPAKQFGRAGLHLALHFLFAARAGRALADQFYEALESGANLTADSPIYHLRERLLKERARKNEALDVNAYAGMIIKGWNYWVCGQKIQRFIYDYNKEKIATIKRSPRSA